MSRLQVFLKTPNPIHPEFLTPQSCQQEQGHNLFFQHQQDLIKDFDEQLIVKTPQVQFPNQKSPKIQTTPRNERRMIKNKISFDSDISQEQEQELKTPISQNQKLSILQTTANKKYDLRISGPIAPQLIDTKEGERTLRLLTAEAYGIVCKMGSTTYKMVSEEIINNNSDILSSKQQNNIKRRVYDALNVLIALGKLHKKGRKITPNRNNQQDKMHRQKIIELKKTMCQKQATLKVKRKYYKNELKKNVYLKKLISRNMSREQKSKSKSKAEKQQKIRMPFIIVNSKTGQINQIKTGSQSKVIMRRVRNQSSCFYGDLDTLTLLKFSNR